MVQCTSFSTLVIFCRIATLVFQWWNKKIWNCNHFCGSIRTYINTFWWVYRRTFFCLWRLKALKIFFNVTYCKHRDQTYMQLLARWYSVPLEQMNAGIRIGIRNLGMEVPACISSSQQRHVHTCRPRDGLYQRQLCKPPACYGGKFLAYFEKETSKLATTN